MLVVTHCATSELSNLLLHCCKEHSIFIWFYVIAFIQCTSFMHFSRIAVTLNLQYCSEICPKHVGNLYFAGNWGQNGKSLTCSVCGIKLEIRLYNLSQKNSFKIIYNNCWKDLICVKIVLDEKNSFPCKKIMKIMNWLEIRNFPNRLIQFIEFVFLNFPIERKCIEAYEK